MSKILPPCAYLALRFLLPSSPVRGAFVRPPGLGKIPKSNAARSSTVRFDPDQIALKEGVERELL